MERFTQIPQELVERLADTLDRAQELIPQAPEELRRWYHELEKAVWKLQVFPLAPLGLQYIKMAEELATRLGKSAILDVEMPPIDVAASVRNVLSLVYLHALRNALDHGIELPQERLTAGKPAQGHVLISGRWASSQLRITVSDDGRGVDPDQILAKAISLGLVDRDQAKTLNDSQKLEFLFEPGFSTSSSASEVSGRGVGMDAIRSAVQEILGRAQAQVVNQKQFELLLTIPLEIVGLPVVGIEIGGLRFWLPYSELSWAQTQTADFWRSLSQALGLDTESTRSEKVLSDLEPAYRTFRKLDSSWKLAGHSWLKKWMKYVEGHALGCPSEGQEPIELLADSTLLSRLAVSR